MKKTTDRISIGLRPADTTGIKGRTAENRIINLCRALKAGNDTDRKDARDIKNVLDFLMEGEGTKAQIAYRDLDTAVRDTFVQAYTNEYTNRRAVAHLEKTLQIEFNR